MGDFVVFDGLLLVVIDIFLDLLHEFEKVVLFQQVEVGLREAALGEKLFSNIISELVEVKITEAMLLKLVLRNRFEQINLLFGQLGELLLILLGHLFVVFLIIVVVRDTSDLLQLF